jgi:hypothetical protein
MSRTKWLVIAAAIFCASGALRAQSDPIGAGALRIQGTSLTLYADADTN